MTAAELRGLDEGGLGRIDALTPREARACFVDCYGWEAPKGWSGKAVRAELRRKAEGLCLTRMQIATIRGL